MTNPLIDKFEELYGEKKEDAESDAETATENAEENDYVIPTAQLTSSGISLTGSYVTPSALISNGNIISSCYTKSYTIPHTTPAEQHFCKVLEDVTRGKATVASISADIDTSFTGFGGQIRYTIEIIGKYP